MASVGELRIEAASLASPLILPEQGRLYTPGWIDFEVKERTIDYTLVSDFVAIKRRFNIAYDRVYGTLFADILDVFLEKEDVTFIEVQPDLTEKSYTCRLDFPAEVRRELNRGEYGYTGFAFTLEEI